MGNIDPPVVRCLWDAGGNRSTQKKTTQAREESMQTPQKGPGQTAGSNTELSCCGATVLTTAHTHTPPTHPTHTHTRETKLTDT